MEKTKIIFLRTEDTVNYYIDVESYRLYTRSWSNKSSNIGAQLIPFSGVIATILGIVSKGNNVFSNPKNNLIILIIMWGIVLLSSIILSIITIQHNKKINNKEKLVLKKVDKLEDKALFYRTYHGSYILSLVFLAPIGIIIGSFYFVENGNMLFFVCMILATMLSSLTATFIINTPKRYKLLTKMKKEGIF